MVVFQNVVAGADINLFAVGRKAHKLLLHASVQVQVSFFPTSFTHKKSTEAVATMNAFS
jgi:hypothetical protein